MIEQRFAAARVAALFGVARTAYVTTVAAGGLLLAILWGAFPAGVLSAWFAALLLVTLGRAALHRRYARDPGCLAPRAWETRFALGALAAGALWIVPSAVFFPAGDPLLQMAVIFVIGGSVIGAAGIYAASPAAFYCFCVPPLLGVALQLAL